MGCGASTDAATQKATSDKASSDRGITRPDDREVAILITVDHPGTFCDDRDDEGSGEDEEDVPCPKVTGDRVGAPLEPVNPYDDDDVQRRQGFTGGSSSIESIRQGSPGPPAALLSARAPPVHQSPSTGPSDPSLSSSPLELPGSATASHRQRGSDASVSSRGSLGSSSCSSRRGSQQSSSRHGSAYSNFADEVRQGREIFLRSIERRRVPSTEQQSTPRAVSIDSQGRNTTPHSSMSSFSVENDDSHRRGSSRQNSTASNSSMASVSSVELLSHSQERSASSVALLEGSGHVPHRRVSAGQSFNATEAEVAAGMDEASLDLFVSVVNASAGEDPATAAVTRRSLRHSRAWASTTTASSRRVTVHQ